MSAAVSVAAADLRPGDVILDVMREGVRVGDLTVEHVGMTHIDLVGDVCQVRCRGTSATGGTVVFQMIPYQQIPIRARGWS